MASSGALMNLLPDYAQATNTYAMYVLSGFGSTCLQRSFPRTCPHTIYRQGLSLRLRRHKRAHTTHKPNQQKSNGTNTYYIHASEQNLIKFLARPSGTKSQNWHNPAARHSRRDNLFVHRVATTMQSLSRHTCKLNTEPEISL